MIHSSQIPRSLITALKKVSPISPGVNKTDLEQLFSPGDIVKCRVNSVNVDNRRVELSMLPFRNKDEDDDYVVIGRDPEGEEFKNPVEEEKEEPFDGESTLLWWRGAPYKPTNVAETAVVDEEAEIVFESNKVVGGTWRRMFESDLREEEADFTEKIAEEEAAELAEEIGELDGIDLNMQDSLGFGVTFSRNRLGSFVSKSILPVEWTSQMEYFKELEESEALRMEGLKKGKRGEQEESARVLRELAAEAEKMSNARGGGGSRRYSEPKAMTSTPESSPTLPTAEEVAAPLAEEASAEPVA